MALPFQNVYHLRTVAEASSKACYVCHKPSVKVLITPDNKDFFYICVSHLNDRGFASPIVDAEAEAARKKKEQLDKEIEKIKQEYEEKQRKKKAKKKAKDDDKDKKKDDDDDDKAEKERDDKIKAIQSGAGATDNPVDTPRVYALHRHFFQMRIDRLRNLEIAKRNQQRIKDPSFFPAAPRGDVQ
ncbi:hypothetical protein A1O7_03409 [Cladophialophora yegresii CBS 114405]|uniref:DUF1742-domain-containing protein n=1 Tax=Cladophialophora yegresii CBS 114405 TaxID=1182544 RepID=W9WD87_9EURO|nr:uncharacterized protein A1O7_03409 [Cladophialophora yegresii CBS 114405]EXJ62965.1 hypothetical protein A1O7_03409 [Cladophialophora yegresii CBS 114405]